MIDALLYAIRDGIRAAGLNYGVSECEIMDDGRPPPRCGNFFLAIHDGTVRSDVDNQLNEWYDFSATLTMRVTVPLDRVADQQIALNIARIPTADRLGFYAKCDRIRAYLHMNWARVVLTSQTPNSANDNLIAWGSGTAYGFCEPMRYQGMEKPTLVGGEWFGADPEAEANGIKSTLTFVRARRFQPIVVQEAQAKLNVQTVIDLTGSGNWICPPGVTSVQVEVWGSGSGGQGNDPVIGGDGGGGGGYARTNTFTTAPGQPYVYNAPAGGSASTSGAATSFNTSTTVATGGGGNIGGTGTSGDVLFTGGDGHVVAGGVIGGGGGGSPTSTGNGSTSNGAVGGTGQAKGGHGGSNLQAGNNGLSPGAGGGGGGAQASGGTGGNGLVRLTITNYPWQ